MEPAPLRIRERRGMREQPTLLTVQDVPARALLAALTVEEGKDAASRERDSYV